MSKTANKNTRRIILKISGLHARIEDKEILRGVDLAIRESEIHTIMGPNGSGKSTLANILAGDPRFEVTAGAVEFLGRDLLTMKPEQRACAGLFLAFQYPQAIPGVHLVAFLRASYNAIQKARDPKAAPVTLFEFRKMMRGVMKQLGLPAEFMNRATNDGFSGGEKKKSEIVQMMMLAPALSVLDEIDSGLDIDSLKTICENIAAAHKGAETENGGRSMLIITHYKRILNYIQPDFIHVMMEGKIVKSGGIEIADELEAAGYAGAREHAGIAVDEEAAADEAAADTAEESLSKSS